MRFITIFLLALVAATRAFAAECPAPPHREPVMHEIAAAYKFADAGKADVCAVASGRWTDGAVWSTGKPPGRGAFVWVPPGVRVIYDARAARAGTVLIDGALDWGGGRALTLDTLIVSEVGSLVIGEPGAPATASIIVAANGPIDVTRDRALVSRGLLFFGRTRIEGQAKTPRARLALAPARGDTALRFDERPRGWKKGDTIVVAGTQLIPFQASFAQSTRAKGTQDERRRIIAVDQKTVRLDAPLDFDHAGPTPAHLTWAVNLSRSVTIRNENAGAPVFERGHILAAHTRDIQIRNAAIVEFGRTDKSFASNPDRAFNPLTATSNVKGRYAIHLHMLGYGAPRAVVEGVAIDGAAGWGIAQHDADADLIGNVVYNAFGAGLVAERGGEAGRWIDNTVIKTTGRFPCISKDADSVTREDLANCGEALWTSRLLDVRGAVVAGVPNSSAIVNMTRLPQSSVPVIPASRLFHPSVVGGEIAGVDNDRPPIRAVAALEAFAVYRGVEVQKSNPQAFHQAASVFQDVRLWNVTECGGHFAYTSNYVLAGWSLVNDPGYARAVCGVELAANSLRMTVVSPRFSHVVTGVIGDTRVTKPWPVPRDFFAVNMVCDDCDRRTDEGVIERAGAFAAGPPAVMLTGETEAAPAGPFAGAPVSALVGDALGARALLTGGFEDLRLRRDWFVQRIAEQGWCERADGEPAFKLRQVWSDRLSAATTETIRLLTLPPVYDAARAGAAFNGQC